MGISFSSYKAAAPLPLLHSFLFPPVMDKIYHYLGPAELYGSVSERHHVRSAQDVRDWIKQTGQRPENGGVIATFVIDVNGQLWVADRRSEHVACAAGQPVLSAGEMTFAVTGKNITVAEVTNQSLGYCPEPTSWPAVCAAYERSGLPHPSDFTSAYTMRLCEVCSVKNIVKDNIFECGVCSNPLPNEWNF